MKKYIQSILYPSFVFMVLVFNARSGALIATKEINPKRIDYSELAFVNSITDVDHLNCKSQEVLSNGQNGIIAIECWW